MDNIGLVLKALEFAAVRHKGQFRKGDDRSPYINHPIQVANLLVNGGGEKDPILFAAAMLHDVVEDTVDTKKEKKNLVKEIKDLFGEEVLSVTLEVTDDKRLSKKERKRLQVTHAPSLSVRAKKLKLADKIANVRDVADHPPAFWSLKRIVRYLDWSESVVAGLRGVNPKLEAVFDESLKEARQKYPDGCNE
jgi:(p)ppGpp synthase/HD superfamily hydrolase